MVWTNVFFFQFPGIKQKPGKGNFRDLKSQNITGGACPRAPLEACSLGPSFRKSVSIDPRSAPEYGECDVRCIPVLCICHYGPQVMKLSLPRKYGHPVNTANFFGPLVTVLTRFHCIK